MADTPIKVSLVIPVRNEEHSLPALLQSIRHQTLPPDEVVLVDGGSTDRTVEVIRRLTADDTRFKVIEAGNATPGRGRNVGIDGAVHDWIALTDAGIRLDPAWLAELVRIAQQDSQVAVVFGNYEPVAQSAFERFAALVYVPARQVRPTGCTRDPFIASSLLRRESWRQAGGFPDLRAAEDLIFMERLKELGCNIAWAPKAIVFWQLQATLAGTFRRFALYSRHNVWAGRQRYWHYGVARQYAVVVAFLILALVHSPWWLLGPVAWLGARLGKSLWLRRDGRGLLWLLNPVQFAACAVIMLTIDLATFTGWVQARIQRPPARAADLARPCAPR
jgi:glycosyltransferase involved in cell wall biosynthesis